MPMRYHTLFFNAVLFACCPTIWARASNADASFLGVDQHSGRNQTIQFKGSVASNLSDAPNEEKSPITELNISDFLAAELVFAFLFVCLLAALPFALVYMLQGECQFAHVVESSAMIVWLVTALYMFTTILKFNSAHWEGARTLTLVEAVYLLSQILTTVGYGDITPAYPRGQVWVAINVILALCLYGSLISELIEKCREEMDAKKRAKYQKPANETADEEFLRSSRLSRQSLIKWDEDAPRIKLHSLVDSILIFGFVAMVGTLFYHYYPGEEKTWLQGVYMSVITLSTVGFGWFNAETDGGKVFGAFWMLCGVFALAQLLSSYIFVVFQIKERQAHNADEKKVNFWRHVKFCAQHREIGDPGMDSYDFFKFGLLVTGHTTMAELKNVEDHFEALCPDENGLVSCDVIRAIEGPPVAAKT